MGLRRHLAAREKNAAIPDEPSFSEVVRFLLIYLPLLLIFRAVPFLATLYSLLVLAVGLYFLVKDDKPTRVVWVLAYIAGAEILWRGAEAAIVWEYGKYATLLLCGLMLLKYRLLSWRSFWPLLFILLLIPGIFVAPGFNRQDISYQLAGPIALAVVSLVCGTLVFRKGDLQRLLLALIAPTLAMGFLVLFIALTQDVAFYGAGENEAITGGIGANQVSSALSLGAMAAFFFIFAAPKDRSLRYLMILVSLALLGLSVLTFSRSGLWNTLGALLVCILFLAYDRGNFFRVLAVFLAAGLLVYFVAFPLLNSLTGGAVVVRFSNFDSTGRDILVRIDYEVFQANPIWGVGVGQSPIYHIRYFGYPKPPHTEYSRLLAEHGSFGVAAILLLAAVTLSRLFSRRRAFSKGISLGFTIWALIYLAHSATRMVAPSLAFGLAAATFLLENEEKDA